MDHSFLRSHPGAYQLTLLHIVDTSVGGGWSTVVPSKSPDPYAISTVVEFVTFMGHSSVILQSDAGPDVSLLTERVAARLRESGITVTSRCAQVASHGAQGHVESWVAKVSAHVRTLKMQLESRLGRCLFSDEEMVTWLVRHSAYLLFAYGEGSRGGSPYFRKFGCVPGGTLCEVGETVLAHLPLSNNRPKLQGRWIRGYWLGKTLRDGGHLIAIPDAQGRLQVGTYRSIRRLSADQAWTQIENVSRLHALPWALGATSRAVDRQNAHRPVVTPAVPPSVAPAAVASSPTVSPPNPVAASRRSAKERPPGWTRTEGCSGCTQHSGAGYRHSVTCQQRQSAMWQEAERAAVSAGVPPVPTGSASADAGASAGISASASASASAEATNLKRGPESSDVDRRVRFSSSSSSSSSSSGSQLPQTTSTDSTDVTSSSSSSSSSAGVPQSSRATPDAMMSSSTPLSVPSQPVTLSPSSSSSSSTPSSSVFKPSTRIVGKRSVEEVEDL